jgi:hypothetical protein
MLKRARRLLLPPVLLVAALALTACSVSVGDKTIDAGSVEEQIQRNVEAQGGQVASVECPGDQDAKKGGTFDCTVNFDDGTTRTAQVELVDDEGTFRFEVPPEQGGGDTGGEAPTTGDGAGGDTGADTGASEAG